LGQSAKVRAAHAEFVNGARRGVILRSHRCSSRRLSQKRPFRERRGASERKRSPFPSWDRRWSRDADARMFDAVLEVAGLPSLSATIASGTQWRICNFNW